MRITISHSKNPEEVKQIIDRGLDDIFRALPVGPVQITDEQRTWVGSTLNFAFNARTAFLTVPVKGWVLVEAQLVTMEVELPAFLQKFLPDEKVAAAVETGVRGLLT